MLDFPWLLFLLSTWSFVQDGLRGSSYDIFTKGTFLSFPISRLSPVPIPSPKSKSQVAWQKIDIKFKLPKHIWMVLTAPILFVET